MNVQRTLLKKMTAMSGFRVSQCRQFSVAYNVKSKFEEAYKAKLENLSKV